MNQPNFTEELRLITCQIEQLQTEVADLKTGRTTVSESETVQSAKPQSRRKLLKRMAVVALGATAATTALATTASSANAAAIGTVAGVSNNFYGLTAAPNGVTTYNPQIIILSYRRRFPAQGYTASVAMVVEWKVSAEPVLE
jgi:hypothetical protein